MTKRLRWGLLATAAINDSLLGPLRKSERSEVVAVAGRSAEDARAFAAEKGIPRAAASMDALIDDPEIDVIYNPLPNSLHEAWTARALDAGKHVLCEKPMVINEAQLERIEEAQQRSGKVVFEAVKYLHHPQTWRILEELQKGDWGKLQMIQGWLHFWLDPADVDNIRLKPELGGGAHWDVGVYPMTYAISLNGGRAPLEVYAIQHKGDTGVDISMNVQMRFADGAIAQISSSFRTPWREGLYLSCDNAIVHVPVPFRAGEDQRETRFTVSRQDGPEETVTIPACDPFLGEVERMEQCILEGAQPYVPLALSREFIRTTAAIYASARHGKPVSIEPLVA